MTKKEAIKYGLLCALADRECPFQGKEFAWCLTCPHISEEDRALVKKVASEPKRGKWIDRGSCQVDEDAYDVADCSVCNKEITIDPRYDNYCPNCGADMRGDEE